MIAGTHVAFAALCGVIAQGAGAPLEPISAAALAFGSILPDIDTTQSGLGKFVKPVSRFLERRFGHRTITHSLLGMAILAALAFPLIGTAPNAYVYLLLGFASHLILDTMNIIGVPLLYPSRLQFWFISNRRWRVPYGSPAEWQWALGFALAALIILPTSQEGFSFAFNRWLGTPSGVVADYLALRDKFEVFADIEGFNTETQETIRGRFKVVDILSKESVIVEDSSGAALAVGYVRGAQLTTYRMQSVKGEAITAKEYDLEMSGRTLSDLLNSLPRTQRVWITANFQTLERTFPAPPRVGRYKRVTSINLELQARSAHLDDFFGLENAFINRGTARVRVEYKPGERIIDALEFQQQTKARTHVLPIPSLPSIAGLIVKPGDRVVSGQPLARYVNDAALEEVKARVSTAKATVAQSKADLERLRVAFVAYKPTLEERIKAVQAEVSTLEYLVGAGAEPRVKLSVAQAKLRDVQAEQLRELSRYTTDKSHLETAIEKAELTIQTANAQSDAALEKQWVKSPFTALVSEVRVRGVTAKGVNLEITLLEEEAK
jgi:membrane-bound metal-dependent hydrolase YbcI (DUF457 family)